MIQIYICEDHQNQLELFTRYVNNTLTFHALNQRLACATTNPHTLLAEVKSSHEIGLYFLDIDLNCHMNGLELAQKIRTYDPRGYIVFITTHSEMAATTFSYKVEAMDFILKDEPDNIRDRIHQCMMAAADREKTLQNQNNNLITLKVGQFMIPLSQSDIVFIQTDTVPHRLILHTAHGIQQITASFKALETLLDSRFFRCHNSVLLNLDHVVCYDAQKRAVLMDNQKTCPVSVRASSFLKSRLSVQQTVSEQIHKNPGYNQKRSNPKAQPGLFSQK